MEFSFKSKFNLEDVVWFMHKNKPVQGIINRIRYERNESVNTAYEHKNIFHKLKSLLSNKKVEIRLIYDLDMVNNDGTFVSCSHHLNDSEIFKTKEELLKSL